MKNIFLAISILLIALVINSCTKDDCNCDYSSTGGIINVNINGVSCDSVTLNESFSADKFSSSSVHQDAYLTNYEDQRIFNIARSAEKVGSGKSITIYFYEKDNILTNCFISINYFKLLDDNTTLVLQLSSYPSDTEITNFSYDDTNGTLKGDYTVFYYCPIGDIPTRTITASGNFNVHVTEVLDKK